MDEDSRCQADYRSPRLKAGTDSSLMSFIKHARDGFPSPSPLAPSHLHSPGIGRWPYVTTLAQSAFQWVKRRQLDVHRLQVEASGWWQQKITSAARQRQNKQVGITLWWRDETDPKCDQGVPGGRARVIFSGLSLTEPSITPAVHAHKGCIYSYPQNRREENIGAGLLCKNDTWRKAWPRLTWPIVCVVTACCFLQWYSGDGEMVPVSIH